MMILFISSSDIETENSIEWTEDATVSIDVKSFVLDFVSSHNKLLRLTYMGMHDK